MDVSFRPILQYGPTTESRSCQTFGALLDQFYQEKETAERVRQKGQDFLKTLNHARERLARKMALQEKELADTAHRERDRMYGDLITANLYRMTKGKVFSRRRTTTTRRGGTIDIP